MTTKTRIEKALDQMSRAELLQRCKEQQEMMETLNLKLADRVVEQKVQQAMPVSNGQTHQVEAKPTSSTDHTVVGEHDDGARPADVKMGEEPAKPEAEKKESWVWTILAAPFRAIKWCARKLWEGVCWVGRQIGKVMPDSAREKFSKASDWVVRHWMPFASLGIAAVATVVGSLFTAGSVMHIFLGVVAGIAIAYAALYTVWYLLEHIDHAIDERHYQWEQQRRLAA